MIDYFKILDMTKKLSVLYVEDDKNFLEETSEVFYDLFLSVDIARNGLEALKQYKSYYETNTQYYDIVITDINMPKMDGITLTKEIYAINAEQSIIVVSAHNDSNYLLEFVNIGIEHFFIKPLDFEKVLPILYDVAMRLTAPLSCPIDANIIRLKEEFTWDREKSLLKNGDAEVKLTKNEIVILNIFIKNGSKVSTVDELTYGIDSFDTLKSLMSRLRKKLPENSIENVYGLGYRLLF